VPPIFPAPKSKRSLDLILWSSHNREMHQQAFHLLLEYLGHYRGQGINHEQQPFAGRLTLDLGIPGKSIALRSSANGEDGSVFHEELSLLSFDFSGQLLLTVTSNNHPATMVHNLHRVEENPEFKAIVFRCGDLDNRQSFREEIFFRLYVDGSVEHAYAWGVPGGEFAPRSGARMYRWN
jgi:hypothetical protein